MGKIMSEVTGGNRGPVSVEEIQRFLEGVGRGFSTMMDGLTAGLQQVGRALSESRQARLEWIRSDEGQRAMRQARDIREIRQVANREKRKGKAEITRMFDDLYAELGIERQEPRA